MEKNHITLLFLKTVFLSFLSSTSLANTNDSQFLDYNSRWSIDLATTIIRNTDSKYNAFIHTIGVDIHKVFSDSTSDIGTLVLQPYIVKLNNMNNLPVMFDNGNDTQLTWRISNFNYTALSQGRFNVRVGHFEIPFGLEYQIDTNGTLRQLTSSDRGIKTDWGMSINGIMPNFGYEVALTRGSGNEIKSRDNPYIFSGRIGSLPTKNLIAGFSWFIGDVLGKNGVTQRQKIGVDVSYYYYQWQFMAESSIGQTAKNDTVNGFVEALWRNTKENLSTYIQLGYQSTEVNYEISNKTNTTSYWLVGTQWLSHNGFDMSVQYKNKLKDTSSIDIDPILSVQLRYRM